MARTKSERKRIYRETVDKCLADHNMRKTDFCDAMGHTHGWYSVTFSKGYYDITKANLRLWSIIIGCTEEELTAIPMARAISKDEIPAVDEVKFDLTELIAMLTDGFRMLHKDLQILTETMDKYWKPTEPKYEVKEREQP